MSYAKVLKSLVKAGLSSAPFTGALVSLWNDRETEENNAKLKIVLQELWLYLDTQKNNEKAIGVKRAIESFDSTFSKKSPWEKLIQQVLIEEIPRQLGKKLIKSHSSQIKAINSLLGKSTFSENINKGIARNQFIEDINRVDHLSKSGSFLLGTQSNEEKKDRVLKNRNKAISIAFPPIMLGVSAIFFYLKHIKEYDLDIHYNFPHAIDLASRLELSKNGFKACVLGDAPALRVINNLKKPLYRFAGFLPPSEQRLATPVLPFYNELLSNSKKGEYNFITGQLSTTLFHFQSWIDRGVIKEEEVSIENKEPHESLEILQTKNADSRLLLWSPHWQIYRKLGIAQVIEPNENDEYWFDTLLFLQHSFYKYSKAECHVLLDAIKDASFRLEDSLILQATVEYMLEDKEFLVLIKRFCGLDGHYLESATANQSLNPTA